MTQSATVSSVSDDRRRVVGLLVLLFIITYLDRVCISVAGPRMQEDLGIDPVGWGWVTGMFTLSPIASSRFPPGRWAIALVHDECSRVSSCGGPPSPR